MIDEMVDFETGPFCIHWSDPSDCDHLCETCGYKCHEHSNYSRECNVDECSCEQFMDDTVREKDL